ncbi:alpha-ketoglutarate-dependent dioxygenase AlkB [Janthinobacterium sp. HH103]|uniref:DNA oxidative demethylase AlkB n=1 Tax=Janthinobacterium agaricidamnosum TaxID=55508 RepID=A0A3G2EAB5_9BURK|nr:MULTISPECIES: DNA oxidative demethylase AlkB [Janthinobacterium]AYM76852.1 DNA oxidative demethylase AlkB [Janthinobacterium agaricidamnosum]OEZ72596.1 alpha-ketoglutarate-dependent dioxygenase AlkB [Janthinobacterium sp. HH100]OEZ86904.1 alpha-ketoglutarate-dependent dioxygenase AlkB [Janthinobacterium sp. HH103]OEZ95385.1 alpha-ketoglutarate-dependent dioxygenase AlkB [Janthinobacterium sp. HH107]QOU74010.1 Alpha-ketoglutarate-dependent dioxygenase AlkB [Janthinobacterium sp. HH102]
MNLTLFADEDDVPTGPVPLVPGSSASVLLRRFALPYLPELLPALDAIVLAAPLRHMATPGGLRMSVAMSNCGPLGWVTDGRGYRYARLDPASGVPWPPMPPVFLCLAQQAALAAGYPGFTPDACLVNRYAPGARMALHQDRDECDFNAPIVSVSLGLPATFLFGGAERSDKAARIALLHGDVVVWGGADRLRFHGVAPLKEGEHALLGAQRINLTFRKAA